MAVEDMFSGCKKIFVIVAMAVLLAGFIGDLIATITWWDRLQPWFAHAQGDGKHVYQSITACWVLSLIGAVAVIFFLLSMLCIKSVCSSITGNKVVLAICFILVGALSVGSIISGGYAASFAVENPSVENFLNNKCLKYLESGLRGVQDYVNKNPDKWADHSKWLSELAKHGIGSDDDDDEGVKGGYLCRDVGAATMTFVVVQCAALILWIVLIFFALIC